jgi:hypothetical protein
MATAKETNRLSCSPQWNVAVSDKNENGVQLAELITVPIEYGIPPISPSAAITMARESQNRRG